MKIFVDSIGTKPAGTEKSMIEFLKFLVSENHDVTLHLWEEPNMLFCLIPKKVTVINGTFCPGKLKRGIKLRTLLWYLWFRICRLCLHEAKSFKKIHGRFDVAIAYCNYGYSPYFVIDKVCSSRKILFYHHGVYEYCGLRKFSDKLYYRKYDKIVPVSQAADNAIKSSLGVTKTVVINNLIDVDTIRSMSLAPIDFNIKHCSHILCTIGRLSEQKNQKFAIEVAKILAEEGHDFTWIFLGDGQVKDELIKLIQEYGLSDKCVIHCPVSNPYPYLRMCDIYIQPSIHEAAPVAIREAMVLHKYIIASDIPSMNESLADYDNKKLIKLNARKFADAIIDVLKHKRYDFQYIYDDAASINNKSITELRKLFV